MQRPITNSRANSNCASPLKWNNFEFTNMVIILYGTAIGDFEPGLFAFNESNTHCGLELILCGEGKEKMTQYNILYGKTIEPST